MSIKNIVAAAVLATSMVAPAMASTPAPQFADVQPSNWAYQSILNLRDKYGVVAGFPDGTFRPGQPATRAQLAALVSASLDRISEFNTAEDAYLAAALRAEFSKELAKTNARVSKLEVAAATKANGVGNYVGAGVLLNQQGVAGNGFNTTQTVGGGNAQGRYVFAKGFNGEFSARPYLNVAAGPNSQIGAAGGATLTYDYAIAKRNGVSSANVYGGLGYQTPFAQYTGANYQSAIGDRGQIVLVLGAEGRITDSLVGYADLKFPTTNAANSYGATNGTYSPVFSTGLGIKF
jgi:hypothetical protein